MYKYIHVIHQTLWRTQNPEPNARETITRNRIITHFPTYSEDISSM